MKIKSTLVCISMCAGMLLSAETLTLEECVDLARSNNPSIQQTELSTEIGKSKVRQAYSSVMPNVSVSSGLSSSDGTSWALGSSYGLSAGMTLYSPGMYSGIKSANINSQANRLNSMSNENDIVSQVSSLYYRILSTKKIIEVYEGNISVAEENLKKTRSMYEQRVITISDVLKSEAQKGDFESQLLGQKQLYVSYLRTMNVMLGRDARVEFDVVDIDVENVKIPEYKDAREMMLNDNPQYESIVLQEKIGKVLVAASKEAFLPSVSGSYSHNGSYDPAVTASNSVGLTASWTLFNGLSRKENMQQSKLQLEQAEINVDNTVRLLDQQLSDLYTQFETYTAMIEINQRRLTSAQRAFEIVNQQYELGQATILDRMQAQITVLSAESTLVEAKYSRKMIEAEILKLINKI
ncbi:MAG: TolC family protein [Candidatus Marinimicrobia bacterium]|nr:TolC family protein [Candidatus Neomarinimicrobiota bacterium]